MARIVINPGRPIGMVHAQCNNCDYEAFVDADELEIPTRVGGAPSFATLHAFVACGNCKGNIAIPLATIPKDVTWKK